ncbi:MAG: type III-B CRISPR-associated protein Cas10/Cmr2 [Prosthecobacter sp.]|uniref:type III-B CRISPR-associated protein Cas10/Cmr2 n=1 Tax=Prosthecobacter sp. TaxID=1965333 RepID=UPI0025FFFA71|nr:type III-B CRISPR-associated protein Cas10/Cmr2 [Prosthecobacter sp.]MCF7786762.1 type III-B CRISPR-associated protein Cas10/Cmr2 [Prosthecobacter sp.]
MSSAYALLKFQIGPVQDFISQARSTRDLWSGSYMLSWLVAAGIRKLIADGGHLIFPNADGQPLLGNPGLWKELSGRLQKDLLTPNLPNLFVAEVLATDALGIAEKVKMAVEAEWSNIAHSVWSIAGELCINPEKKAIFDLQVAQHLSIAWQITPINGRDYAEAYRDNGWHLDSVRQTRDFKAAGGGQWRVGAEKDSLSGREEALCGGPGFSSAMQKRGGEIASLFKHDDHVGAITLIKRVWHITHLRKNGLKTGTDDFVIRSIPAIAARSAELDDTRSTELYSGDKYVAAIAFDGDSIGKWVDGRDLSPGTDLHKHHQNLSDSLSDFALNNARKIVETDHNGFLVYAGGDDVVALVPADAALDCAKALRTAFRASTESIKDKQCTTPDASAGIVIAHVHAPLQDLIRAAQKAEKRAKNTVGRPAFSVTLMKRSGEISEWGSRWDSGGVELYERITSLLDTNQLTTKFPYRVCQMLEPYLIAHSGLSKEAGTLKDVEDFAASDIIHKEFVFAAERQGSMDAAQQLSVPLRSYLMKVPTVGKSGINSESQPLLSAIIGLCTTVAFAHRTRPESKPSKLSAIA